MDQKAPVNSLLDDGWFFGNTLANKAKMVRCYSDPCPCQSEMKFTQENEEDDDDDDEPRMGDLIRQAMPLPVAMARQTRLDRAPSLPPCRPKQGSSQNDQNGVGRLTRRASIDSSLLVPDNGFNGMAKFSRRSSIDSSSMFLPPKYTSKGAKQSGGSSKKASQRKQDVPNKSGAMKEDTRTLSLSKSKSEKRFNHLDIEELQGFKDLGFSFDSKPVISSKVGQLLPAIHTKDSIGCGNLDEKEASTEHMKAKIKFWARVVASNVRQEC